MLTTSANKTYEHTPVVPLLLSRPIVSLKTSLSTPAGSTQMQSFVATSAPLDCENSPDIATPGLCPVSFESPGDSTLATVELGTSANTIGTPVIRRGQSPRRSAGRPDSQYFTPGAFVGPALDGGGRPGNGALLGIKKPQLGHQQNYNHNQNQHYYNPNHHHSRFTIT
ncbi:unnamed protein product [Protopolystoma xenopodis]|uniref:Uncharacterized protein n=1 Tax=Protopolystoma xenopodis TaxID=117903 RepID=A0A448XBV5_9PLAT|nr:unnamed protein product [Protopolystoma xenopodis]